MLGGCHASRPGARCRLKNTSSTKLRAPRQFSGRARTAGKRHAIENTSCTAAVPLNRAGIPVTTVDNTSSRSWIHRRTDLTHFLRRVMHYSLGVAAWCVAQNVTDLRRATEKL